MNLETIISEKIIHGYIIKDKVDYSYPPIDVIQDVSCDCYRCGAPVHFPLTPNMVNMDDLIKSMGKHINKLKIREIELLKQNRVLTEQLNNRSEIKKQFIKKIDEILS